MRAVKFITGHVTHNSAYTYKFQLKTTIDRIVDFQLSVNYYLVIFCMVWYAIFIWTKTTKNYVSDIGCYLGVYAFYFLPPYAGLHSFSISIFRYICIIHPQKLSDRNLTPEVRKSKALIFYLVLVI